MNILPSVHLSPETAYIIPDYPYGFNLRCKMRMWIESPIKGQCKGKMRLVTQTTNPKKPGEYWNKPKYGIYHDLVILIQQDNGHIENSAANALGLNSNLEIFRDKYYEFLDEIQKNIFNNIISRNLSYSRVCIPSSV